LAPACSIVPQPTTLPRAPHLPLEVGAEKLYVFMQTVLYFCSILTQTGICKYILVKLRNIKFNENSLSSSRVVSCAQTEGQSEINSRVARLRKAVQSF
jgi:hypothetical protein